MLADSSDPWRSQGGMEDGKQHLRQQHVAAAGASTSRGIAGKWSHALESLLSSPFLTACIPCCQVQEGDKLAIDADGEPSVDCGAGVLTSVRRWATGQGRVQSVVWLEGLADRVQGLAAQQMRAALEAEADAASARQSPDMCPQCSQATCSCLHVGILHAMTEDVARGLAGVKLLLAAYSTDANVCRRGLKIVSSLEATLQSVSGFLSERPRRSADEENNRRGCGLVDGGKLVHSQRK